MIGTEPYDDRIRDSKDPEAYRRSMIDFFFAHGENLSGAAHQAMDRALENSGLSRG